MPNKRGVIGLPSETRSGYAPSFQLIQNGIVALKGSISQVVERSLRRIEELIDRSLTEVRLRVDPEVRVESGHLSQVVDQILATAIVEARQRNLKIEVEIDPALTFEVDQQAFHSALSNLIQNAIKFTKVGGRILLRGSVQNEEIVIEVQDECGWLKGNSAEDLFKPFMQKNQNRKGLGLGLTIAKRAIEMNHGKIEAEDVPGRSCIFKIKLLNHA